MINVDNSFLLQLAIIFPFLIGLILFLGNGIQIRIIKWVGFFGFLVPFLISLWLAIAYGTVDRIDDYAYYSDLETGLQNFGISLKLGLNGISLPLFVLAGIVSFAAGLFAINSNAQRLHLYLGLLLIMSGGLIGMFAAIDIFFFYFFHELALVPTFIMIGIWGGKGRRSVAMELTIYLMLGAMLSLIGLISIYSANEIDSFDLISLQNYLMENPLSEIWQRNIFGILMVGFGILVSLFPFHTWAPKAYATAPTSVSMLHAGVLKKFGLYGLIQIAIPLLPSGANDWVMIMGILALCNIVIIGLITMAQKDLKMMVAYSSVMHMGYGFLGIVAMSVMGFGGSVLLMFAHGLSVALLFLLGSLVYQRTETYDMTMMGGLSQKAPILCGFFLAAVLANIGLPGFANFWAEIVIFLSLWEYQPWMVFVAVLGVVISAIYGLRAVANIFFGQPREEFKERFERGDIKDITIRERIPVVVLLLGLIVIGFWPKLITESLNDVYIENSVEVSAEEE
ncbi:MAG: NADH-quinone oxidoreductase subunit N [Verrucomicrobia bacterium]|nr:MAG: NADH-quinone oxidoreductase subunit N [Verrucomicrobiota bacterium]